MARVGIAVQRQKNKRNVGKTYSSEQISKQLAGACLKLSQRTKAIERNEKNSWAKARNRSVG